MIRSGIGFDTHQLKTGFDLYIGGIKIDSNLGSLGHSDGDALIHALADSLLGAAGMGDIGQYFPSEEKEWKNAKSEIFLILCFPLVERILLMLLFFEILNQEAWC